MRPDLMLTDIAGGYLRNPVRAERVTCAACLTPVDGWGLCFACNGYRRHSGLADRTGFLTYAIAGQKSGHLMRGYKAPQPVNEHVQVVGLMLLVALEKLARCAGVLAGSDVTHWAAVPSLPAKPGEHPLRRLVAGRAPGDEAPLMAASRVEDPRSVNGEHFSCASRLSQGSHVLLVDDTWTTGGHAQSAAIALREAGAEHVSALVVARWLKEGYRGNRAFVAELADRFYDPLNCPWTSASCPS